MFISPAGRGSNGKYRLLVGSPAMADEILRRRAIPHAMSPIFDDIARRLTQAGFEVIRNPLPITYVDDRARRVRTWYFASSNNCLVEIDGNSRHVWLPTYGYGDWRDLRATDTANEAIWRDLGFEVHLLTDYHPFAQNLGAVHCIKKYLAR